VTFNHGVQGSNPCGLTNKINDLRPILELAKKNCMADDDNRNDNDSRRGPLIGLLVIVFLFVIGWVLAHELYAGGKLEDCLLSGRTNCQPIQSPTQ
jgi:hypothetical protein